MSFCLLTLTYRMPRSNPACRRRKLVSRGLGPAPHGLWLAMMSAMVVVGAWLFYASIDPDEAAAGPATSAEMSRTAR